MIISLIEKMKFINKSIYVKKSSKFFIKEEQISKPSKNEFTIKVLRSSICSSDMNRVFGGGAYYYPILLGHEFSGIIVDKALNLKKSNTFKIGDKVSIFPLIPCFKCKNCSKKQYNYCINYDYYGSRRNGGFSRYLNVSQWNLHKINELNLKYSSLIEPVAVAFEALKKIKIKQNQKILVVGSGFIGAVICKILSKKYKKKDLYVLDRNRPKLNKLDKISYVIKSDVINLYKKKDIPQFDYIFDASSAPNTIGIFIEKLDYNGKLIILSNHFKDNILKNYQTSLILRKNLELHGSWNSDFKGNGKTWENAISFIKNEEKFLDKIVYGPIKIDEIPNYFNYLKKKSKDKKYFNPQKIIINNEIS
mgnify:CR=1 FL=1